MSRAVELADTFNVRDLGGLTGSAGRVRRGRFFRGASLHRLRGDDVRRFEGLGVGTVVDLRTGSELVREGAFPSELGIAVEHAPLRGNVEASCGRDLTELSLSERYLILLEEAAEPIRRTAALLSDPDRGGVAVYCAAGKDRTGVVVAAVLGLLGVEAEQVVDDYHRSEAEVARMMEWLRANYPPGSPEHFIFTQPREVRLAPREQMERFLAAAGSWQEYAARIGLDVPRLRRAMLEPAPA
jgi:protein-tyrosine phosphatase